MTDKRAEQQDANIEWLYRELKTAEQFTKKPGSLEGEKPRAAVTTTPPRPGWRYCFGLLRLRR